MKEIRHIISMYEGLDWTSEKAALATVVSVEESAYRRIGARMFVKNTGDWIGGISGGCLEGDALKRAQKAIFNEQPSIVVYDTMEDDAHQIGVGLGCNGRIEVLFTPIDPDDTNNPIEQLKKIVSKREASIFYQLIGSDHEVESNLGLVADQATKTSFCRQLQIKEDDLNAIENVVKKKTKSKIYQFKSNTGKHYQILIEFLRPELKLILVGDNYDVNAFVGIADELGWEISVIGLLRKLEKSVFDRAQMVLPYEKVDQIVVDEHSAIVLMSHDYKWDMKMLEHFMQFTPSYIGMLGPKKRMIKMENELKARTSEIDLENLQYFFSPVGLDIGAESPEEIALSITAEIISVFRNRSGQSLKFREGTIHEREYDLSDSAL